MRTPMGGSGDNQTKGGHVFGGLGKVPRILAECVALVALIGIGLTVV